MKPTISVLMPTFNSELYLAEAVNTILKQSYKDFELIIVDGGSTDTTDQLIKYFVEKDKRVKYFKKKSGIAEARNYAFKQSKGDYIAVCDSDDVYHPNRLKMSLNALKKADISYSGMLNADENGRVFAQTDPPKELTIELLRQDQQVPHPTIMAKRKCFEEHPYRKEFTSNDDLMLIYDWFLAGYTWKKINTPVTIHRHYNQSVSVRKQQEAERLGKKARKIFEAGLKEENVK